MFSSFPSELCFLLFLTSSTHCGHIRGFCGTHTPLSAGTAGLGAGAHHPTGPPPAELVVCAAPSLSTHSPSPRGPTAQPPCGRRSPPARLHISLPALLCHRKRGVSLTHHTPQGNQITIFFRWLTLHVHLPCLLSFQSLQRFPPVLCLFMMGKVL